MLDNEVLLQLKSLFDPISSEIELVYRKSAHADQNQLIDLLNQVAEANSKIQVRETASEELHPFPGLEIWKDHQKTGIQFSGIPSGHEFSSLVLAILNTANLGRLPDEPIRNRIRALKGIIHIRTFVSLTCENCPDVVQILNQFALVHPNFTHEMIDGAYTPEEIERMNIQGVPSVMTGDQLLHSGKIHLIDLLEKLEKNFGSSDETEHDSLPSSLGDFDVVVVGGGPAGVSSAIYSVRKGLRTAIITDKSGGQVLETKGIENFISVPYTEGPELAAHLYAHARAYPIQIFENRRVKQIESGPTKKINLERREYLNTQSIIIASGAKWRELNVPGEKEYLGRGVAFCPHCDGPFYKGKSVAVVGGGNSGVEAAIDLAGIVNHVTIFEFNENLKADEILIKKLKSRNNISIIVNAKTESILGDGKKVTGIEFTDRKTESKINVPIDGVFIQIGLVPNSQFVKGILNLSQSGEIIVDPKGRTSEKGIYSAGDVTTSPFKQIIIAMGDGAKAALTAFEDRA